MTLAEFGAACMRAFIDSATSPEDVSAVARWRAAMDALGAT